MWYVVKAEGESTNRFAANGAVYSQAEADAQQSWRRRGKAHSVPEGYILRRGHHAYGAGSVTHGHAYLTLRDALGTIFTDEDFASLFPPCSQPGLAPWRLALVTIMQFREHLADCQVAEAVRAH